MFNNAEEPLKAQSSIQVQGLSTMVGKLKAQRVQSGVHEFGREGNEMCVFSEGGRLECRDKLHICEKLLNNAITWWVFINFSFFSHCI